MDLDISALKQGSNREVLFTPSLTLKDDSLSLPAIRIAGRNRYYHHLRNASDTERLYRNGERNLIEYRVTVPYENGWEEPGSAPPKPLADVATPP